MATLPIERRFRPQRGGAQMKASSLSKAEAAQRQAFHDAIGLAQSGKLAQAERALAAVVAAAPNNPLYALELAQMVLLLGRRSEAERWMERAEALARSSGFSGAQASEFARFSRLRLEMSLRLGDACLQSGQIPQALGYLEQAVALGAGKPVQDHFIHLLFQVTFSKPHPSLKPILQRSFEEHWADPMRIGRFSAHLLLLEADFQDLCGQGGDGRTPDLNAPAARRALTDPLLLTLLDRAIVVDPALERLLTGVRRAALRLMLDTPQAFEDEGSALLPFCAALANQCYAAEFAYAVTGEEAAAITARAGRCAEHLNAGQAPEPLEIAILAAYGALHEQLDASLLLEHPWPTWLQPVITRQVREPAEEARLKLQIPVVTDIRDRGSLAVQNQYEDNPFPRWTSQPPRREPQPLSNWVRLNFPAAPDLAPPPPGERRQALIAGCGTGQETVGLSFTYTDVDCLAVDLSKASLAHAIRKSHELGLEHVTFACADLLELRSLDRRFELVVSAGVLHHLDDPMEGWRTLRDVTQPGGLMLIALYSGLARRNLAEARAFAAAGGYGVSAQDLRRYRADILGLAPSAWRQDLLNRDDFYSLSMLRDLVFHVRETDFSIRRIQAALKALDLRFCGFAVSPDAAAQFQARFGRDADLTSLDQWDRFEAENPDTFWHMYHFLVQRT